MYSHVTNDGNLGVQELFQKAGLLFEVETRPLYYQDDDGNWVRSTIKRNHTLKAINSTTEFDCVSESWKLHQPKVMADWTEQMVEKFDLIPYAAGAFEGGKDYGKIGWFQAKLPGDHVLLKKDRYDPLFTITSQQKYASSWCGGFTATRIICRNTFHAAESTLQIRLDHRKAFDVEFISTEIKKIAAQWISYKEKVEFLAKRKLTTGKEIADYFQALYPSSHEDKSKASRAANRLADAWALQPGADIGEGTWYQAFNAVTYAVDHVFHTKNPAKRAFSAQYGDGVQKKIEALKLALGLATKSPELV